MLILGKELKDHHALKIALTSFFGIGRRTALRVMARYSIHEGTVVRDLTQNQITSLTSFLSSPITSPKPPRITLAQSLFTNPVPLASSSSATSQAPSPATSDKAKSTAPDPLSEIKLETDLRREILENIAHQRTVGSYIGRRHAMHLPVRGQNTRSNAQTASKLNRLDRRA